jgi:hypothetical protein
MVSGIGNAENLLFSELQRIRQQAIAQLDLAPVEDRASNTKRL